MGRRGADGGRACAAGQARLLRQLAADRRAGRAAAVDRACSRFSRRCRRSSSSSWGWRVPVPPQRAARRRRPDHPRAHPRDAGVRQGQRGGDAKRGSRSSKCCARYPTQVLLAMGARFARERRVLHLQRLRADLRDAAGEDAAAGRAERASCSAPGVELVAIPFFGALSDRIGRRPVYLFGAVMTALSAYPLFRLLDTRIAAARLAGADRGVRALARGDVRAAGGVPLRAVRHARALQRRVAGLAAGVGVRRRTVAVHRRATCSAATAATHRRCT